MTFVKTRVALDKLAPGDLLHVTVSTLEAAKNIPVNVLELGYRVLSVTSAADGASHAILIAKPL